MHHIEHSLQLFGGSFLGAGHKVGIAPCHHSTAVTEQLGQHHFAVSQLCQMASKGMPKTVEYQSVLVLFGVIIKAKIIKHFSEHIARIGNWSTTSCRKNELARGILQPLLKHFVHGLGHGDITATTILGFANENCAVIKVEIADFKSCNVAKTQATLQGKESHEPKPGTSLLERGEYFMQLVLTQIARPFVINLRHSEFMKRRWAAPHFPFHGLIHDSTHKGKESMNSLWRIPRNSLFLRKTFKVGYGDSVQRTFVHDVRQNMLIVRTGILVSSGLVVCFQPVGFVSQPCHFESRDVFDTLRHDPLDDLFLGSTYQALPYRVGIFGGEALAAVSNGFANPLATVGVVVVDAVSDVRLALVFFASGGALMNTVKTSTLPLIMLLIRHIYPLTFATFLRPTIANSDYFATHGRDEHEHKIALNSLRAKGNIHRVMSGMQGYTIGVSPLKCSNLNKEGGGAARRCGFSEKPCSQK